MLRSKAARGAIAGIIAGILPLAINFASQHVGWSTLVWADFASVFIYGRRAATTLECVYAIAAVFWWLSLLGVIYAYLIDMLKDRSITLVGWYYGTAVWFMAYAVTIMYDIQEVFPVPLGTSLTHFISASIWGITLAFVLRWLSAEVVGGS